MSEKYLITCGCGAKTEVQLFDAGTKKVCASCRSSLNVPSSIKLKELSGDKHPLLSPLEKIQRALNDHETPFDGLCHACRCVKADYLIPITFDVMLERHVSDDGGIRPTLHGGVKLVAGAADELWQGTTFPLQLCSKCHVNFQAARSSSRVLAGVKSLMFSLIFVAFLYLAVRNLEFIAVFAKFIWLIGAIAWALSFRLKKRKFERYSLPWIRRIRWVPEALDGEDEYRLTVGNSQSIARVAVQQPVGSAKPFN
ncbi:MAG: hypothetical protein JWM11_226 [Planctomycetaceae bacterium]|nr:hypothetical protein [Planctomycetaceae bacterium]